MIGSALHGKHIVLTGVTGFVGKVFAVLLLDRFPEIGRLTLLVRGGREGARARFERIADTSPAFRPLKERYGPRLGEFLGERIRVVESELTQAGLGMSEADRALVSTADAIVHCAGITDFDPDPKKALATNTVGALAMGEFAREIGAKLLHVSTCYVAGVADGEVSESLEVGRAPNGSVFRPRAELERVTRFVHKPRRQDRIERGRAVAAERGWSNIYTWSKGLAEHLLADLDGLELTIVRPSIVECARNYPFEGWNEGINTAGPLAWLISTAFRRLPANPDNIFDVVPVDEVVRGMLVTLAALLDGRAPRVVQLASGDVNPLVFRRAIELTGLGLRRFTRRGGGTELERTWFRHLDPIAGEGGWVTPVDLRSWLPTVSEGLEDLAERELPSFASRWVGALQKRVRHTRADVEQIEDMLALYRPFIGQFNWIFQTNHARDLSGELPESERDLAFDAESLDWCRYWVDVEYPGLMRWCVPILRGQEVKGDPPSVPPLRLTTLQRVASK